VAKNNFIALLFLALALGSTARGQQCTASAPCSLLPSGTPAGSANGNYELGVRFFSDVAGTVTGVRFYKPSTDPAKTHVVNLWSTAGAKIYSASTSNETASGWQVATFATPVPITAATQYIASYIEAASFSVDRSKFTASLNVAPLHAPASTAAAPNAPYANASGFPTLTFQASNYWVDVLFVAGGGGGGGPTAPNIVIGTITVDVSSSTPQHSVSLTWTETDASVTGYNLYRGTTSGGPYTKFHLMLPTAMQAKRKKGTAVVQSNSYVDGGLTGGATYFYVVTALNSNGESVYSNQTTAAIPSP
jgi:hypothetical protein